MMNIQSLKLLVVFVSSVTTSDTGGDGNDTITSTLSSTSRLTNTPWQNSSSPGSNSDSTSNIQNTASTPSTSTTATTTTTNILITTSIIPTTILPTTTQDNSVSPNSSNCTCLLSDNNQYGLHGTIYSLLGLIIISFSLNIVVLCAFLLKRNRTINKSSGY